MDFDFNEDQYMLRDSVRGMLADRWSTRAVRELVDAGPEGAGVPTGLATQLAELGLPGMLVPEAHGGLGLGMLDFILVAEEFGRALVPGQLTQTILASLLVARHGAERHRAALLPRIAAGELQVAVALQETDGGYDMAGIHLAARRTADGWRLNGRKLLVPYADAAGVLLVAARRDDGTLALFVVDRQAKGVSVTPHRLLDPSSRASAITFDGVTLGEDALLGDQGEATLATWRDLAAATAAAELAGCAASALDMAVAYAKQRKQFGQVIGSFQAIKHKCADMIVALETSRSAIYYAAWALSEGTEDAASAVSMAKAYSGDACRLICNDTMQIHGGIGYTWDLDVHLYMKRGKYLEYSHGDAPWHRERVIAHAIAAQKSTGA